MSEKISKISVDGVVYDIASTGGGEVPGDIQEQLSALENKVTEEASAREEGDAKLQAAIDELAEKVNGEGADLTELEGKIEKNAADIATVNNNLVEAVNNINKNVADGFSTINGGLNNEIRPELEKAVKYEDTATEQNPGRKTIFLNNHDNICGKTTDGSAVNIAMVSKWNKVDLGSSSVEINLNGSAERPTYNDTEEIALLKDVQGIVIPTKVSEFENDANYQSASQVDARIQEVVAAAPEALDTLKELADALGNDPDFAGTVTTELAKKANSIDVYTKEEADAKFITEHQSLEGLATETWVESKGYLTEHQDISGLATKEEVTEKEAEIEANLASTVKFTTSTYEGRDKKVITLDNDELINARSNSEDLENKVNVGGKSISLIQLNRWNVVDVGSPYTLTNINTPKGQRPTVQEAGQSGPEANQIAYVSDVAGLSNTLEALNATVQILQSKVDVLTKTNTEVVSVDGSAGELKDSSKDYIVSGSINENAEIVGKSISLKSIKVSDNARLKLNAGDVEAKDLNISGSFPKANGNTVISVNNAEFIVFKDMVFDASEVYNGIEIGLASNSVLPKNILFDNCKFQGEFSNNAILVFGTQDNAIITLNNCYFEKISNALRLSNKSNASGVVVNINNCTVDQWDTRAPWQGFLICEDYTNKTEEEVNANNLFGDGKITVNFNNLVHAGVKINPADPASVCGTKNESQVVMVCQDAVAGPEGDYCLSYDAAKFPVVSFK